MRFLLDTHTLLWFIDGDEKLSSKARSHIENPENDICVSIASFYEIAIKLKTGKLSLSKSLDGIWQDTISQKISILPISKKYLLQYDQVPLLAEHRDPFDRLIIASAIAEDLTVITKDEKFANYQDLITIAW
jgi:PIN domain nuclease of toxin-antitoxin system